MWFNDYLWAVMLIIGAHSGLTLNLIFSLNIVPLTRIAESF